jgi:hypothetical protein
MSGDRIYEVLFPITGGGGPFAAGLPLAPTRAGPIAYANVAVTAVDRAAHASDRWPGTSLFAGRAGNESRAASPQRIYRLLREPPEPPEPVVLEHRVYASPADWHGRSFYTFRWRPQANLRLHVLRALDEAVFQADWAARPRQALAPSDANFFPDQVAEPVWDAARRALVCTALNALNSIPKTPEGKTQALRAYRDLSDDALPARQRACLYADHAGAARSGRSNGGRPPWPKRCDRLHAGCRAARVRGYA